MSGTRPIEVLSGVNARLSNSTISGNHVAFHVDASTDHAKVYLDHCTVYINEYPYELFGTTEGIDAVLGAANSAFVDYYQIGTKVGTNVFVISFGNNSTEIGGFFNLTYPPQ